MRSRFIQVEMSIQGVTPSLLTLMLTAIVRQGEAMLQLSQLFDERWRRQRTRRALGALSDHELHDIGLTRGIARFESSRRWWD
ncbi:MAG: DUF1127 domain-containing protein [Rhizobiaceae bacterium]|jgi:uncharacterized protein YjiS (DUF1127 family)|nr:DUF1127 domain-containing protein [Rhizobiaceae bacterium]